MPAPLPAPDPRHLFGDGSPVSMPGNPPGESGRIGSRARRLVGDAAAARRGTGWDRFRRGVLVAGLLLLAGVPAARAGDCCRKAPAAEAAAAATALPAGSLYQLEAAYTTDAGRPFRLAELRGRPVVLAMFFASCNYACPLIVADLTRLHAALPAPLRDEVALVLVSFDVARDTPEVLARYRAERLLGPQWTLLRGDDDAVAELAALLGVKYKQEADGQFAHSNLFTVLDRDGEVVHQRAGLQGGLPEAAAALVARVR